jgi:hypothetical protein
MFVTTIDIGLSLAYYHYFCLFLIFFPNFFVKLDLDHVLKTDDEDMQTSVMFCQYVNNLHYTISHLSSMPFFSHKSYFVS